MPVKILPPWLANQIAAGEVVERPASVVKELIENALDAKAKNIAVEVKEGGKALIRVKDDGIGMVRDDLALSVERHATSKLSSQEELYAISTLGFRGEALPSIGAVSELTVKSRPMGEDTGWMVRVFFGGPKELSPCQCPIGTIVEVRDIFLEIPARRRFLRGHQTELNHISKVVRLYAVAYPEVHFSLKSGTRPLFSSPSGKGPEDRFVPILGKDMSAHLLPIKGGSDTFKVEGYVSLPGQGVRGPRLCYFFLNKRPFQSRLVLKALKEATRGLFMRDEYPAAVLFLEVEPSLVDVNCHPSKQEVRFRHADQAYRLIYSAVKNALLNVNRVLSQDLPYDVLSQEEWEWEGASQVEMGPSAGVNKVKEEQSFLDYVHTSRPIEVEEVAAEVPSEEGHMTGQSQQRFKVIGQVLSSYIVCEAEGRMFIVDQHGAHEGLLFKRLQDEVKKGERVSGQALAFPLVIERTQEEMAVVDDVKALLWPLGFDIETFGESEVAVRRVPSVLFGVPNRDKVIISILEHAFSSPQSTLEDLLYEVVSRVACTKSVRIGQELHPLEMESLINDILNEGVVCCAHGRPVIKEFTKEDLERFFRRR